MAWNPPHTAAVVTADGAIASGNELLIMASLTTAVLYVLREASVVCVSS